jgi:hypothetical protein
LLLSHALDCFSHRCCCCCCCLHVDMPELMGGGLNMNMFNNMDPAQLAQLQKMAAQVRGRAGQLIAHNSQVGRVPVREGCCTGSGAQPACSNRLICTVQLA